MQPARVFCNSFAKIYYRVASVPCPIEVSPVSELMILSFPCQSVIYRPPSGLLQFPKHFRPVSWLEGDSCRNSILLFALRMLDRPFSVSVVNKRVEVGCNTGEDSGAEEYWALRFPRWYCLVFWAVCGMYPLCPPYVFFRCHSGVLPGWRSH